jgi:undecaprenyl-diphosphatase
VASGACGAAFALLAVLVTTGWQPLLTTDERQSARAYAFTVSHHWCEVLARAATWMGNTQTLVALTALVVLGCVWTRRFRLAAWLAVTVSGSALVNSLVKAGMERLRPPTAGALTSAHGFAFPSGHSQGATSTYVAVVLVVGWQVWRPGAVTRRTSATAVVVLVGAVGLSRLFLGVHWPSDVLGGWLLGSTCVLASTAALLSFRSLNDRSSQP